MTDTEGLVAVARETLEFNLLPWVGRWRVSWLLASTMPHPRDPAGQVLVPERIYNVFKAEHVPLKPITARQLREMGAP